MALPIRRVLRDTGADTVRGIGLVCGAYVLMALGDGSVKWALPAIGLTGAMIGRGVFGASTVALLAAARGGRGWRRLVPVRWQLVALRSTVHSISSLLYYLGWQLGLTLADSYAIGFCTPLLMTALAVPLLHERLRWQRMLATVLGFAGVLVMLRPGGALWTLAALVTLFSIPLLAVSRILTRLLSTTETPECLSFWLLAAHVPAGLLLWTMLPIPGPTWPAVLAVGLLGLSNGLAHWVHSRAFALAPVGALAPYEYTSLIWGSAIGWVGFRELPTRDALLGAAIVAGAGLYNWHRERARKRAEQRAGQLSPPGAVAAAPALVHAGAEGERKWPS